MGVVANNTGLLSVGISPAQPTDEPLYMSQDAAWGLLSTSMPGTSSPPLVCSLTDGTAIFLFLGLPLSFGGLLRHILKILSSRLWLVI